MVALKDWQKAFADSVLSRSSNEVLEQTLSKKNQARMPIYERNVYGGITKALTISYPSAEVLVGEAFFRGLCNQYIQANPPISGCLEEYGEDLPAFTRAFEPAKQVPYMADVLDVDWAVHVARRSHVKEAVGMEALMAIDPEQWQKVTLKLQPSTSIYHSDYPAHSIWYHCQHPDESEENIDLSRGGETILIAKTSKGVNVQLLTPAFATFCKILLEGKPLLEAFENAANDDETFALEEALQSLFEQQLVTLVKE